MLTAEAPPSTRSRAWGPPLAVLGAAAAAAALLTVVDPNQPGHLPGCPFKALTGWDCPGCGSTRALWALVHGDVPRALDHNVLTVLALPVLAIVWLRWTRRRVTGRPGATMLDPRLVRGIAVLFVVFAVVRNLPGVPFLGSGVG